MEAVLVTRHTPPATDTTESAPPTTSDLRLTVELQSAKPSNDRLVSQLPQSEWAGSSAAGNYPGVAQAHEADNSVSDPTYKSHALVGFSDFGSGDTNEFATWTQGRETFLSDRDLRESYEDDLRSFAERSDHTEGFMLTTPISNGFGGFTSAFLELLRDEFAKAPVFTTATMSDAHGWKREDTERSRNQRLINEALSLTTLEELSSMVMPIQPPRGWDEEKPWNKYLRDDVDTRESHSSILTQHLQSANSELREAGALHSIVSQLNWRGDNKFVHLQGASPMLPPDHLSGPTGQDTLRNSIYDFSLHQPRLTEKEIADGKVLRERTRAKPFAQYTVVRGYEGDELQQLGEILEPSTGLKEPLAVWVCLPQPYPIFPTSPPIYRSLLPDGRPLILHQPIAPDPFSPAGLFHAPNPLFPSASTYTVQPTSVPIYTALATTPDTRFLLDGLAKGMKELRRVRWGGWWEYEEGEYGVGREGVEEARERLEGLVDALRGAGGGVGGEEEADDYDTDEHFSDGDDVDFDL